MTLAHSDFYKRLYVSTDACDTVWSAVITQVPYIELAKPHVDQAHELLAFLSQINRIDVSTFKLLVNINTGHTYLRPCVHPLSFDNWRVEDTAFIWFCFPQYQIE